MRSFFTGSMLGLATGEAFAFMTKDMDVDSIRARYGHRVRLSPKVLEPLYFCAMGGSPKEALFIADALLWADAYAMAPDLPIKRSLIRFFHMATGLVPSEGDQIWVRRQSHERAGSILDLDFRDSYDGAETTLEVLSSGFFGSVDRPINDADDPDAVVRALPIGLFYAGNAERACRVARYATALTHGDADTVDAAGAAAAYLSDLILTRSTKKAGETADRELENVQSALSRTSTSEGAQAYFRARTLIEEEHRFDEAAKKALYITDGATMAIYGAFFGALFGEEHLPREKRLVEKAPAFRAYGERLAEAYERRRR